MNSSIEIAEAVKLADKLIARTREGKLAWGADGILRHIDGTADLSRATAFTTKLEGDLRAEVSIVKSGQEEQLVFSLVEFDPSEALATSMLLYDKSLLPPGTGGNKSLNLDKEILKVSVEKDPSFGYDTIEEKQLARLLVDLYGLARRSALKIDGSVEKALSYLDKLAV
jgi:hypothetical protein